MTTVLVELLFAVVAVESFKLLVSRVSNQIFHKLYKSGNRKCSQKGF